MTTITPSLPPLTKNGFPAAYVIAETAMHYRVKCPHCGEIHTHGAALGTRVPHCWGRHSGLPHYEIVKPETGANRGQ